TTAGCLNISQGLEPMTTSASLAEQGNSLVDVGILDRIIAETRLTPDDDTYDIAKRGVSAFIEELLKPHNQHEPVKNALVGRMIAAIGATLSLQIEAILHHPSFQMLASVRRGLKLLVDRTNIRENIKLEGLFAYRQDLLQDFEDSPEVGQAGLYNHVHTA